MDFVTLTEYDEKYGGPAMFHRSAGRHPRRGREPGAERFGSRQKYPHVTYFFNGGVETRFPGEEGHGAVAEGCADLRSQTANERSRGDRQSSSSFWLTTW